MNRHFGAASGLALFLSLGAATGGAHAQTCIAHPDNFVAKDGNGNIITKAAKNAGGCLHDQEIVEGLNSSSGNPQATTIDNATGGLNVNVAGGTLTTSAANVGTNAGSQPGSSGQLGYWTGSLLQPLDLTHGLPANILNSTLASTQSGSWTVGLSGTLPAFAATPTFNLGTIGTAATAANQSTEIGSLATIATNSGTQATAANQTAVQGSKAPGTAASNSLLAGGVYTAAGITLTTGQQAALQFDSTGHLLTTASVGGLSQGSTTSGQTGILNMGAVTTAAPTYTTAQTNPLSLTTAGDLRVTDAQLLAAAIAAIPAGSNTIGNVGLVAGSATVGNVGLVAGAALVGKFGIDQTTPGGTNGVQDAATGATGSAVPSKAIMVGGDASGNLTAQVQSDSSAFLDMSTATTTQIVALASSKKIYVTSYELHASGTTNVKFVYGTGSNCATGTTQITANLNLIAADGVARGNGLGVLFTVPASNALCVVSSAAQVLSADVSYTQF